MFRNIAALALCTLCSGLIPVLQSRSAPYIDNRVGAILVSLIGALTGIIFFWPSFAEHIGQASTRGFLFIGALGVIVLLVDYFALLTYQNGMPVSVGGPIIIGGSIAITTLAGFLLGESFSFQKVSAIGLILAGAVMLSYVSGIDKEMDSGSKLQKTHSQGTGDRFSL